MNLKRCPECNRIINVDNLEDIDLNEIVGCGMNEDNFAPCDECGHKYDGIICKSLRKKDRLTKTTVKEYGESL